MSNSTGKRALVAPQGITATNALAYQAASADFHAALTAARAVGQTEAEVDQTAEAWWQAGDRLLGTPAHDLAAIAEKVEVLANLHNGDAALLLRRPEDQRAVAESSNELAKGLLTIYLDLAALMNATAIQASVDRAAWDKALSDFASAKAKQEAIAAREAETGKDLPAEWNEAREHQRAALEILLTTRAPDSNAMAAKARFIIEEEHCFYTGETPDCPDHVSRLLAGSWDETFAAAIYQDGLALSGASGGVVDAKPAAFDPAQWLDLWAVDFGVKWEAYNTDAMYPDHRVVAVTPDADVAAAEVAYKALPPRNRECVRQKRDSQTKAMLDAARRQVEQASPADPAVTRRVLADALERADGVHQEAEAARAEAEHCLSLAAAINGEPESFTSTATEWQEAEKALTDRALALPNEPRWAPVKIAALRAVCGHDGFVELQEAFDAATTTDERLMLGLTLALTQDGAR